MSEPSQLPQQIINRNPNDAAHVNSVQGSNWLKRSLIFLPLLPIGFILGMVTSQFFMPPKVVEVTASLKDKLPAIADQQKLKAIQSERNQVAGLGLILPQSELITLSPPYGTADARIAELRVKEGDTVTKGQIIAVMDNEAFFKAALEVAKTSLSVNESLYLQTKNNVRASKEEAVASLNSAEVSYDYAKREYERGAPLHKAGYLADAANDQRKTNYKEAEKALSRAKAALSRYNYDNLDQQPDVMVALSNREAAKANLAKAEQDYQKAFVTAPSEGTILKIHRRVGEPAAGAMLEMGDIRKMIVKAEIYEDDIALVRPRANVTITAKALGKPLQGTVDTIGRLISRQNLVDKDPAANTDARVFEVTINLSDDSLALAKNFVNLQVIAQINADR